MIYFILPIYNEERIIRNLILELQKLLPDDKYKIVAVNDGSSDHSLNILEEFKSENFLIENYCINMNIGAVFASGIERVLSESHSLEDIAIIMESDQTSSIDFVPTLIAAMQTRGDDVVIASRYKKGGGYRNFPFMRRIFSYCANRLMHFYFPVPGVSDYTIFFRAYRTGILKEAVKYFGKFGLIQSKGFVANAELLVKISLFTNRISEVPFTYDYGKKIGKSKITILRTINEYFVVISYLKRIFKKIEKYKSR